MKRRHSHKNEIAWKCDEVRLFLVVKGDCIGNIVKFVNGTQVGIINTDGTTRNGNGFGYVEQMFDEFGRGSYIEITKATLPYLVRPDGEFELRVPKKGDIYIPFTDPLSNTKCMAGIDFVRVTSADDIDFYRWCRPRKSPFEKWWGQHESEFYGDDIYGAAKDAWEACEAQK